MATIKMMADRELQASQVLAQFDQVLKKEFDLNKRVLSFDEYLSLTSVKPKLQLRGSAQYCADMMEFFGTYEVKPLGDAAARRFKLFDFPIDGIVPKVVGLEDVQEQIYRSLRTFARQRINNKLLLLHGPNGSAKSSIIHAIMGGLERYCQLDDGAVYSFNWVFPLERYAKGGFGLGEKQPARESVLSFAKLSDDDVAARVPCDLKDHPLLLIPAEHRFALLEKLFSKEAAHEIWELAPNYLTKGGLCHRCKQIFDALLTANGGDFSKLLMHVQVERFYFSRRYRKGLVTVEPQLHVDANYQQLSYNKSLASLPSSLQSINLFTLSGDIVEGNRGVIEYSDLLKRPVDSFKYLLGACETGATNIGSSIAYLDAVMLGSTNEIQLDAFKEFPDFTSFKARIELIRVPYLLSFSQEREIYTSQLSQVAGSKHVSPHVDWAMAFWGVLTRLKKPNSINYQPNVSTIISNLTPLEKATLYDSGEVPEALSPEDRKLLKATTRKLKEEYSNVPYYEGRIGASAREVKSILFSAAQNPNFSCLSPLGVFLEIEEFVKRVTEYDFLKQDVKDGFHDAVEFINTARTQYIDMIDREVRDSIGLYESAQWEDFLRKYVLQTSLVLKKEKTKNPITGRLEDVDMTLIAEFEKIVEAPSDADALEMFRQNVISRVGVWSLDHPKEPFVYAKVFPEYWRKLEKHYYETQKALLTKMSDALLVYGTGASNSDDPNSEGAKLASKTVANMKSKLGYCERCAKEVITFLMRSRY